jgi:four helix bundle protein
MTERRAQSAERSAQSAEHGAQGAENRAQGAELRARSAEWPNGRSFRELKVWQRSVELCVAVYKLTADFPHEEIYGLSSQLRRAAVSVASNLAEGYGRASKGEFRQFVGMARGSVLELQTQMAIAKALGYGREPLLETAVSLSEEIGKMTWALLRKLR